MKFNGPEEALKLLRGLNREEQVKILDTITKTDPEMGAILKGALIDLNDLIHITPKMLVDLLKRFNVEEFGAAMRLLKPETQEKLCSIVSERMAKLWKDQMTGNLVDTEKLQDSHIKLAKLVQEMVDEGKLILKPDQIIE